MAFLDNKNAAYVATANAIASEAADTPKHAKRMVIAKQLATGGGSCDWFITVDFKSQGFDDSTTAGDMTTRLSSLISNLVALDFGG